jgi:arylsulfatase A-like enzyme
MAIPDGTGSHSFRFWHTALAEMGNENSIIRVEVSDSKGWHVVEDIDADSHSQWGRVTSQLPQGRARYDSLRFTLLGGPSLVALGAPLLVPETTHSEQLNLLVLFLDTVRADRLGCYGYEDRPTSEKLDSLFAAKGFTVFKNAYSPAPQTLSSAAKFFSSRYLHSDLRPYVSIDPAAPMLAEIMNDNGYYCAAYTAGGVMRTPGFERGFHEYHYSKAIGKVEDSFPQASAWLHRRIEPFFLLLHSYEAHQPYTRSIFSDTLPRGRLLDPVNVDGFLPPGWDPCSKFTPAESTYISALYDGGVRTVCDAVARLFIEMDELSLWENTVVVVLSDHGEEFGDHFPVYGHHSHSLYEELLHVPFALYAPSLAGRRMIDGEVSLVDLVPTLASILNLEWAGVADGVDLSGAMGGNPISRSVPILAELSNTMNWDGISVIEDRRKYIEITEREGSKGTRQRDCLRYQTGRELYRLDMDPSEISNIVEKDSSMVQLMAERLREGLVRAAPPVSSTAGDGSTILAPALENQLRALGYLDTE